MLNSPRHVGEETDGLNQLKSLLFRGEADRLKAVETIVDNLDKRVGDAPRLEAATAEVLVEALRRAEVAQHRELADAIAPVVVASIRNEIQNSRETMVETLYPITGQMVLAAVANAFRELVANVNERLERATSVERWKLQLRARITGRPVSELAIAAGTRAQIIRVLFLERGSGLLLSSWRADGQSEERGEMIGALIAALTGFARDALGDSGGDLRTLSFGGRNIYVQTSPAHIIAAEFTQQLRAHEKSALDRECLAWLSQYARDGVADNETFRQFIEGARTRTAAAARKKGLGWPLKIAAACVALLLIGYSARSALYAWRERAIDQALAEVLTQRPSLKAFPIEARTDHADSAVTIRGLVPTSQDAEAIVARISAAAGSYKVAPNLGVIATGSGVEEQLARAEARNAELAASLRSANVSLSEAGDRIAALSGKVDELQSRGATIASVSALGAKVDELAAKAGAEQARLSAAAVDLAKKLTTAEANVESLHGRVEAPRERLSGLIGDFSIFFDRDQPITNAAATDKIDAIASLLKQSGLGLRIVGYSDDSGAPANNASISRKRADAVADLLTARGVDKAKLIVVGRAAANPIADPINGRREQNRRVTFELPYAGEIEP